MYVFMCGIGLCRRLRPFASMLRPTTNVPNLGLWRPSTGDERRPRVVISDAPFSWTRLFSHGRNPMDAIFLGVPKNVAFHGWDGRLVGTESISRCTPTDEEKAKPRPVDAVQRPIKAPSARHLYRSTLSHVAFFRRPKSPGHHSMRDA